MKIINSARKGLLISIAILVIALVILIIVNSIPNVDTNTFSTTDKLKYSLSVYKNETPIWKIVCYIIVGLLIVLSTIISFIMCRCHFCGRHIHYMNIFTMYCPYCGKSLDTTK